MIKKFELMKVNIKTIILIFSFSYPSYFKKHDNKELFEELRKI